MPDILHRIGIKDSSVHALYQSLTTQQGLAGWWTRNTVGEGNQPGDVIRFRFGAGGFDMKVLALHPTGLVEWEVVNGPEEWVGTRVQWAFRQEEAYTILLFTHSGWREPVEFMHHCSTKWAVFLLSLKALLETGEGHPDPHDTKIDNWN